MLFCSSVGRLPIPSPAPNQIFDPAFSNKSHAQLSSEQEHSSVNAPAPRQGLRRHHWKALRCWPFGGEHFFFSLNTKQILQRNSKSQFEKSLDWGSQMPPWSQKTKVSFHRALNETIPFGLKQRNNVVRLKGSWRKIKKITRIWTLDFQDAFFNCCYVSLPPFVFHTNAYIYILESRLHKPLCQSRSTAGAIWVPLISAGFIKVTVTHTMRAWQSNHANPSTWRFPTQGRSKGQVCLQRRIFKRTQPASSSWEA